MGEILEIRGEPEHERYRIRWEDGHESIFHPADGEATIHHYSPHGASVEIMRSLREQKIDFEPRRHPRTQTAMDEARALHASADHVGKTLVVHASGGKGARRDPRVRATVAAQASRGDRRRRAQVRDARTSSQPPIPPSSSALSLRSEARTAIASSSTGRSRPRVRDRRGGVALRFVAARDGGSGPAHERDRRGRDRRLTAAARRRTGRRIRDTQERHRSEPVRTESANPRSASARMRQRGLRDTMEVERR